MAYFIAGISVYLFWVLVIKPMIKQPHFVELHSQASLESIVEESKLLKSKETPTAEHILKYYKMYLAKDALEKQDMWTTKEPMSFEKWEATAKTPTKTVMISNDMGFQTSGGYQFLISMTCDAMVGFPPNQQYLRYNDYAAMVELNELETKNG